MSVKFQSFQRLFLAWRLLPEVCGPGCSQGEGPKVQSSARAVWRRSPKLCQTTVHAYKRSVLQVAYFCNFSTKNMGDIQRSALILCSLVCVMITCYCRNLITVPYYLGPNRHSGITHHQIRINYITRRLQH